jgi:hypothetical protein
VIELVVSGWELVIGKFQAIGCWPLAVGKMAFDF